MRHNNTKNKKRLKIIEMGLKVYKDCCKNCLLSADSIVSPARRKQIVKGCIKNQTHFFCHKSTIEGTEVVCKTFFDKLGHYSQMVRIAERLNMVEYVDQPVSEKLKTWAEMNRKNTTKKMLDETK